MNRKKTNHSKIAFCNIYTNFNQAGLIGTDGNETPITEKMLQMAFDKHISAWESWKKQKSSKHTRKEKTST